MFFFRSRYAVLGYFGVRTIPPWPPHIISSLEADGVRSGSLPPNRISVSFAHIEHFI